MAIRKVLIDGDEILRKKSKPVTVFDDNLAVLLDDMFETMHKNEGAGLAGVQVGVLKRLFVMKAGKEAYECINPEIIKTEGKNNIEMFGTKGGIKLAPEFELYTEINDYLADVNLHQPTALSFDGLFENEIDYFVDSIINDRDLSSIAEDGCTLMKILDAIYESARTGNEVKIK